MDKNLLGTQPICHRFDSCLFLFQSSPSNSASQITCTNFLVLSNQFLQLLLLEVLAEEEVGAEEEAEGVVEEEVVHQEDKKLPFRKIDGHLYDRLLIEEVLKTCILNQCSFKVIKNNKDLWASMACFDVYIDIHKKTCWHRLIGKHCLHPRRLAFTFD